ncbi:hypothetical protein SAMN05444159_2577 [Bradyrhizobium lablabi]|uniref:Uncharacterized protein n=1 Tax=Bradyrhizobium lablabi TaxID=722472 RepID=A0A1M6Q7M7_9BRAD|nr:DUF5677 domain-containing protein [Bradyrhizobium lablabi]SHK16135.1 hypothetical protein SAMN05444159_2577 [Bradyrhizobium lablabi]
MKGKALQTKLQDVVDAFARRAQDELEYRLKKWPADLSQNEVHEVIGALLARQVTLAVQLASSFSSWNGHVGPLFLRTMADVYINIAWVLCDPDDRAKKFILYGLGQAKLELEHRRADLATREAKRGEIERNQIQEDWINRQRATFLTDVNLGSWSGISTRTMADEAGCLDFYNYVYTPFSSCTHSTWYHVARYNLIPCNNPLHRYHSVPAIIDIPLDPHYLHLAARYLQKTLAKFDEVFGKFTRRKSALDVLTDGLAKLEREAAKPSRRRRSKRA